MHILTCIFRDESGTDYTMGWTIQNLIPAGTRRFSCVNSGFRREVDENCAVLGYYAAGSGNSLPTFQDNLSAPSSNAKNSKRTQDS